MYCQNCGAQDNNPGKFCAKCGAPLFINPNETANNPVATNQPAGHIHKMGMLSKEDYLAISTAYQKEKEMICKKYRNIMIFGIVIIVLSITLVPAILIPLLFTTDLSIFSAMGIALLVATIGVIIAAISESYRKSKPEELGIQYYQKYVAEYNASTKND